MTTIWNIDEIYQNYYFDKISGVTKHHFSW